MGLQDLLCKVKGSKVAPEKITLGKLEGHEVVCTATVTKLKGKSLKVNIYRTFHRLLKPTKGLQATLENRVLF